MNTAPHMTHQALSRLVLSKEDIECSLVTLAPGEQTPCEDAHWTQEHLLFTIDGAATVEIGDVTFLINKDDALYVAPGKSSVITADKSGWAKLLRVDFTRRTIVQPPIFAARGLHAEASQGDLP